MARYITDYKVISKLKEDYIDSSKTMKDMLNEEYPWLPYEDKVNLIYWCDDQDICEVKRSGCVEDKH